MFCWCVCYRHPVFINDGASDEEDVPIAENIYSDASSDTELSDEDDTDYSISSYPSTDSLQQDLQDLEDLFIYESIVEIENIQNNCPRVEETRPTPSEPSTFTDKPSSAPLKKFKNTVPRSRQGVGKKKARRIENGKLIFKLANFILGVATVLHFNVKKNLSDWCKEDENIILHRLSKVEKKKELWFEFFRTIFQCSINMGGFSANIFSVFINLVSY